MKSRLAPYRGEQRSLGSTRLIDWLLRHPLSRTGATAASQVRWRRRSTASQTSLVLRLVMHVLGVTVVAVAALATLAVDVGVGPYDAFLVSLADLFGVPLAVSVWGTAAVLLTIATVMGHPPRLGTLSGPLCYGVIASPVLAALAPLADLPLLVRLAIYVGSVVFIGLGAGCQIVAGLGAGTAELFSQATARRFARPSSVTRMMIEIAFFAFAVVLGGPIGIGTVVMATMIGPTVARSVAVIDPLVNHVHEEEGPVSDRRPGSPSRNRRRPVARGGVRVLARR